MKSAIYAIRSAIDGKIYVGSAVNYEDRWSVHRSRLNAGNHHSIRLQRSWSKHGAGNFTFEVLELVKRSKERLIKREQHWIDKLGAYGLFGFNMSPKATTSIGVIRSAEYRAKQSRARTGMKLKPHTEATKEKIRRAHLGRPKGPMSEAHKLAISKSNIGRKMSAEARAKMSAAAKGRPKGPMPQWHKDKIAEAIRRHKRTPEKLV